MMHRSLHLPALLLASHVVAAPVQNHNLPSTLQNILANTDGSNLYTYPTDLTRGIVPVRLSYVGSIVSRDVVKSVAYTMILTSRPVICPVRSLS